MLAPGSPEDPIQLIDVRDLGEFLVRLIEDKTNGVFNALGPDSADDGPDARGLQAGRAKRRDVDLGRRRIPRETRRPWLERYACLGAESGDTAGFAKVSNARALKAGLNFRPIADTAKATLDWFRTLPEDRRAKLRAGISPEREAKVLAAWKARAGKP